MEESIKKLKSEFLRIKSLKYIQSNEQEYGNIGDIFEAKLGKNKDNFFLADYNGIEIKTMREESTSKLHLFNAGPDGDYLFPIKRILNILGYPDRINKEYKVLNIDVNAKKFKYIGYYKKVKLHINKKERKIELLAANDRNISLEVNTSWSFDLIEERINKKIKYLALIKAKTKVINGKEYFYYKDISFYKMKDFSNFIKLIEKGIIIVTFKIGVYRSGDKKGQIHDRGTGFSIEVKNIRLLYDKLKI